MRALGPIGRKGELFNRKSIDHSMAQSMIDLPHNGSVLGSDGAEISVVDQEGSASMNQFQEEPNYLYKSAFKDV